MEAFGFAISEIVFVAPTGVVLLVGIILLIAWRARLSGRSVGFGVAGCIVLGLGLLINIGYSAAIINVYNDIGTGTFATVSWIYGLVNAFIHAVGVALLLAAVLFSGPAKQAPSDYAVPAGLRYPPA